MLGHLLGQRAIGRAGEEEELAARQRQVPHWASEGSRQRAPSQGLTGRRGEPYAMAVDDLPSRLADALGGRYALERELGRGGMSIVYLARDVRHGRRVALKVLRPEL